MLADSFLPLSLRMLVPFLALALTGDAEPDSTSGVAQTLDRLLRPVLERAYGLALRLTRNPADAEDIVQEAALAACRGFGTFQQGTNFKAWFFRILTNCFYARHRRRNRDGEAVDLDEVPDLYLYNRTAEIGLHQNAPDPAQHLLSRLDSEQIAGALQRLPEEYRVVATLYFIEDFSYEEIAGILGIPVGTVRSRLHRGRKILQQHLWRVAVEHGVVAEPVQGQP